MRMETTTNGGVMKHYRGYKKAFAVGKNFGTNKKNAIRHAKEEGYDMVLKVQPEFSKKENEWVWTKKS